MMPAGREKMSNSILPYVWIILVFCVFFVLEQFLHWHHCHKAESECKQPLTYLILFGDGLNNFVGMILVPFGILSEPEFCKGEAATGTSCFSV